MVRLARVVLPGHPHHITQRGNRRQDVCFEEGDCQYYLELLAEWCRYEKVEVWAYCLISNHVHLIVKPGKKSNIGRAIGEVHRRYTRMVNFREDWKGYLWQGRFASYPMDNERFVERAGRLLKRDLTKKKPGLKVTDKDSN
jgi:putative transposase